MRKSFPLLLPAALAMLAGCGSSSSSSSTHASGAGGGYSARGSSGASATAGSSAAAGGAYGAPAAGTSSTAAPAPGASAAAATIQAKPSKLGTILAAGPKRLTVYLFEADANGRSACSGACAKAWPPVTTNGAPRVGAGAMSAELGTIKRSDGTMQVTYKGHPLYMFEQDKDSGDAYGEGVNAFGAGWYVLRPNGTKIDRS